MDISDSDRQFLSAMRALTMDEHGNEVYVGLDVAESVAFNALSRLNDDGAAMPDTDTARFHALRTKHERARQAIVDGKAPLHP